MNFTSSPFERMMKEVPHPGWDNDDPCKGCRYYKECKGKKKQCRKKFRALIVEPRPSGHRGPKDCPARYPRPQTADVGMVQGKALPVQPVRDDCPRYPPSAPAFENSVCPVSFR